MNDFAHRSFAEWLQRRRKQRGLTQSELADLLNCSTALIQKIERGERRPSRQIAALLAERLNISPDRQGEFLAFARGLDPQAPQPAQPEPQPAQATVVTPLIALPQTALFGRSKEIAQINELLQRPEVRLISLVGPGGIGKTLLAQTIAYQRWAVCPAAFVALEPVANPTLIAGTILDAIGIGRRGVVPPAQQLVEALSDRKLLLVLDNLEHLLAAAAAEADPLTDLLRALIDGAPNLQILTTSREPLRLRDEWIIQIDALELPAETTQIDAESGAVALFLDRMRRVNPHHDQSPAMIQAIARICRLVDGLPLAIELAAAWTNALSPQEIADELARSPDLLSSALRDAPARHRSMQVVFEQSWRMLSPRSAVVLGKLALLPGGVSRETASFVARAGLTQLSELVQKSLLRRSESGRYTQHPIIRYYSLVQLQPAELAEAQQRLIDYHLAFAVEAGAGVNSGDQERWIATIAAERDNLRAALQLSLDLPNYHEAGARICTALRRFWSMRGLYREGLSWVDQFLARSPFQPDLQIRLLISASHLTRLMGDITRAIDCASAAVALIPAGTTNFEAGEAYFTLGTAQYDAGLLAESRHELEKALAIWRVLDNRYEQSATLNNLANATYDSGDAEQARKLFREGLAIARAGGFIVEESTLLMNFGFMGVLEGDREAGRLCAESLPILVRVGNHHGIAFALEALAAHIGRNGHHHAGTILLGAAETIRIAIQAPIAPANQPAYERFRTMATGDLAVTEVARLIAEGRAMPIDAVLDLINAIPLTDTLTPPRIQNP